MKTFIFIVGALVALWIFMPWDKIGEFIVLSAERRASSMGVSVRHSSVSGSWYGPKIVINDFSGKYLIAGGEFRIISVTPLYVQSIIHFSPAMSVSFSGGKVSLPVVNDTDLGSGQVEVSYKDGVVLLKNLISDGEISLNGYIAIRGREIDEADLMIKVPEKFESYMSTMKAMIPSLNKESTVLWRIKKEKSNG